VDRAGGRWFGLVDPVAEVLHLLARADDPGASALLLADRRAWTALLERPLPTYAGNGADLRAVVNQGVGEPGPVGDAAVRAGLEALGGGLAAGHPEQWAAHRTTAAALVRPLAGAVARRPALAAEVVLATGGAARCLDAPQDAALRGLGYLSTDPGASSVLGEALARWARQHPATLLPAEQVPVGAFAVGSFVAVREYGQRLAYALHGVRMRDEAEARASNWTWAINVLTAPIGGPRIGIAGSLVGMAAPFVAPLVDAYGTWDNGPDTGLVLTPRDAVAAADAQLQRLDRIAAAAGAVAGYRRTTVALGLPLPPASPTWYWLRAVIEGLPLPFGGNDVLEDVLDRAGLLEH
jgi:hypothetical protein